MPTHTTPVHTPTHPLRVLIYCRTARDTGGAQEVERQAAQCEAWLAEHYPDSIRVGVYTQFGGRSNSTPVGLAGVLARAEHGDIDVVLVTEATRISRRASVFAEITAKLFAASVRIATTRHAIEPADPLVDRAGSRAALRLLDRA